MFFKHPEILYTLFALIIPILIHLFQLQKFEKVKFTNVKLLQEVEQQTRKSSKLKKWLILFTRLLLLTALIFAFAQPYYSKNVQQKPKETFIYLDNSLSMQAKGKNGELLKIAIQDLIESFQNKNQKITIFTNDKTFKDIEVNNDLLNIDYHPIQKDLHSVFLQVKILQEKDKNTSDNIILISDFQNKKTDLFNFKTDTLSSIALVQLIPENIENIAIDSLWIKEKDNENLTLKTRVKSYNSANKSINVSFYVNDELKGKTNITIDKNKTNEIEFITQNTGDITGYINIDDANVLFDNTLYFSIPKDEKTKVLAIGKDNTLIAKIYNKNDFHLEQFELKKLEIGNIFNQNLVILNQLDQFPKYLINSIQTYIDTGGNLVIIPSSKLNITSYNELFSALQIGKVIDKNETNQLITNINYEHPFFKSVFKKQIKNYQYPTVFQYINSNFPNASNLLSLENGAKYISEIKKNNSKIYWIASALNNESSNFTSSPLIIPIFYNFSLQNNTQKQLYYEIGKTNTISVGSSLEKDEVMHLSNGNFNFIPLQITKTDKVILTTTDKPFKAGIYKISNKNDTLKKIAFNYDGSESNLQYTSVNNNLKKNIQYFNSVKNAITEINEQNKTHNLWQLFLIFALIFLVVEILLEKLLKNQ
ncbi:MAG: BatA domain-containing protein [Bacteroidota bacterium]